MTTSSSYDYSLNAGKVCDAALRKIGNLGIAFPVDPADRAITMQALNVLVKSWRRYGLWLNQEVVLFLTSGTERYSIGSDRAVAAKNVTATAVKVAAVSTDVNIDVDSTAGMTAADVIGIVMDDNTIHWDTIANVTDSDTVVITNGMAGAAAIDNKVYFYTAIITRPTEISNARLRDNNDRDVPVEMISKNEYMRLSNKSATGNVNQVYFDPQRGFPDLYTWPVISDERYRLYFTAKRYAEDLDKTTHDLDFPVEWLRPIIWNLADEIKVEFGVDRATSMEIARKAQESLEDIEMFDRDDASTFLEFDTSLR